jgi:hypothetical protein
MLRLRVAAGVTVLCFAAVIGGCSSPPSLRTVQPAVRQPAPQPVSGSSSASGTVERWDVVISVAATLTAGDQVTAIVKAVNSTETTLNTRPLLHLVIRDSSGHGVRTNGWQKYVRVPHAEAAGSAVSYTEDFTVPAPGRYTISLAGMVDSSKDSTGAIFTSVK